MISEREVLRELADRCRAAGAEVAARVLALGNDVAVSRLPPDDAVLVLELVEELVREGMNEDVVEALALWRDGCAARALEHDVARSRLQPTEAVLVLAFVDELVCHGMSVDVAAAWGLWRDGCAACALYRIDGAPGDRCDEHGGRA